MKIKTSTGSVYELDLFEKRFRRLSGEGAPTPRMGADGEWRNYQAVSFPTVDMPTLVSWRTTEEGVNQCTQTSPVKEIFDFTETDLVVCKSFDTNPSC